MLPFESENRQLIAQELADEFALAKETLDIACLVPTAIAKANKHPERVRCLLGGLVARELRRYRSIIAVLELGYAENAAVLCRSLYEGLLCERFILRSGSCLQRPTALQKELGNLTPDKRASIYVYFPKLRRKRQYERIAARQNLDDLFGPEWRVKVESWQNEAVQEIGPRWIKAQKDSGSYSGLSLEQLAQYCDLEQVHLSMYSEHCIRSHGNDGLTFLEARGDELVFRCGPDVTSSRIEFVAASAIIGHLIEDVSIEFKLNLEPLLHDVTLKLALIGEKAD